MQLSIYLCTFSSTCFGLIRPSSETMDVIISLHIQHMVSLVLLGVGLPEDGRVSPKHVELKVHK